jgi:hypothetical protein
MKEKSRRPSPAARNKVPWQLRGPRPKRRSPRPLIDSLVYLDIRSLGRRKQFPGNWHDSYRFEDQSFLYPGIKTIRTTRAKLIVEFYGASNQTIPVKWYRPGFGGYRPIGKCQCGRTAFRFYKMGSRLVCHRCTNGRYASQVGCSKSRPHIQARRLQNLISGLPKGLWGTTHKCLWSQYHGKRFLATALFFI